MNQQQAVYETLRVLQDLLSAIHNGSALLADLKQHAWLYVAELGVAVGVASGLTRKVLDGLFPPRPVVVAGVRTNG